MKPVGVLGGMGPEATILLMQKVLLGVRARDDADHVPLIVHQNPQVPSRIAALIEARGADPGPVLASMARDLEDAGAQALAMPCNTAHHYAASVTAASALPFLDMITLTAAALSADGARRVGMLASPALRKVDLYGAAFADRGMSPVWTAEEADMLDLIRAVKAGRSPAETGPLLARQAEGLLAAGADHLLIACTELSLLTAALPDAPWRDSLDCLTGAIVEFAQAEPA